MKRLVSALTLAVAPVLAITGATSATATTGIPTATPNTAPNVASLLSCAAGDDWLDYAYVIDPTGGAAAEGLLCKDHVTTGDYWSVVVTDQLADGKCAHAAVIWRPAGGDPVGDYGMYVCGDGQSAAFTTPVRNWTGYATTELDAFVDAGPSAAAPPYRF
jgi:hypothetical protein